MKRTVRDVLRLMALAVLLGQNGSRVAPGAGASIPVPLAPANAAIKVQVVEAYGKLPLHFEANQGQTDPQVKFLAHGHGYTLFLTSTEAVLSLYKPEAKAKGKGQRAKGKREEQEKTDLAKLATRNSQLETVVHMKLVGANPGPQVVGLEELPGKSNYFIGNDPKQWHTNIPTYARVRYQDVYPGIDLAYYGNQRQLEYDFVVAPGADPGIITLAFNGLAPSPLAGEGQDGERRGSPLRIDDNGDLILQTAGGEIRLHNPRIYQEINGVKQPIPGGYVLLERETQYSELKTQMVGFQVAAYNTNKPLVIDPVLIYSTYLGGSSFDTGYGVAVDSSGNAYVTGETESTNFPTTPGAFQPTCALNKSDCFGDAFVVKLDPEGSALVYTTYLGGSDSDGGADIAVDAAGNAYVTGGTCSTNFPTTRGAFQTTFGGDSNGNCVSSPLILGDAFVVKLNSTGSALVYSTYLGGRDRDGGAGIAVDAAGNAYVTGSAESATFPTTPGAFQPICALDEFGDCDDAFVAKLNPEGSAPVYSTYLSGSSFDTGYGIAVDAAGNAYVTGRTSSPDFPTTEGAFQLANGGSPDAFVTKLNPTGSALVYSTYLGGSNYDVSLGIALDAAGNAYVAGGTCSTNFPTTPGAFQTTFGGVSNVSCITSGILILGDAFVAKLNSTGSELVYATYLGGRDGDGGAGIAVNVTGHAYVTGLTESTTFPTTLGAFQPTCDSNRSDCFDDAFVAKLDPEGSALVYSTYLGGGDSDLGFGIAVDGSGSAYVTGRTHSLASPRTASFQGALGGKTDAFIAKLADTAAVIADLALTKTVTSGQSLSYTVVVTNNGPDIATGVTVTDVTDVTESVTFVSATPSQGSCSEAEGVVTCNLATLSAGASATVTIVVAPVSLREVINMASVFSSVPDPDVTNNSATAVTKVTTGNCRGTGPFLLEGRVSIPPLLGVPDITLTLSGGPNSCVEETTTGPLGKYQFEDLAEGTYTVTPSGEGFLDLFGATCFFVPQDQTVTISGNTARVNFICIPITD